MPFVFAINIVHQEFYFIAFWPWWSTKTPFLHSHPLTSRFNLLLCLSAIRLLQYLFSVLRTTPDPGLRDLSSAVLWNLSSCDSLKQIVIQESLQVLAKLTVRSEPRVFTNVTGCLRNLSSAGAAVRKKLRSFKGNFSFQK